ncbi:DUF6291 domain-containing protein [Prevotella sp. 885]|uniref:DUF6291 domain-containing protein n=1 Tax=Prevotella sp. 885 TaxID=2022527 RepID=UPI000BA02107|nr:DUF6291 domain-containing protein [Prevotella sp. 885]OZT04994.1 hypothetical protein CHL74_02040 [Prevotella sp. 885]
MSRNTDKGSIVINTKDAENMLQDFTKEEAGEIFMALLAYANRGEEYETDDRSMRTLFRTIQANIDRNNERYEEKCERNRQIALEREKKRKEAREREKKEEHERTRTCTFVHDEHERTPIGIGIEKGSEIGIGINNKEFNIIKEPKGSMSETSSDAASEPHAGARSEAKPTKKEAKIDLEKVRQQFNRLMEQQKIPKLKRKITGQRKAFFEARVRENGIVSVYRVMIKAAASNFLNGGGRNGWLANFEWLFRPNNFPKVLDGYYDNPQPATPANQTNGGFRNDTTAETPAASGRANNRNEQRATEQRERIQGYAGVASKWRQIADSDTAAMGNEAEPPADLPR